MGRLYLAVQQSSESIVSTGLDSRIQYANPATFVTSGYSASELIGSNASILGSGKTPRATFEELYRCLNAGERWHGHLLNRRKDGTEFTQETTVSPVRMPDGAITQYVAVMTDVTERLRLENELREHREHLEEIVLQRTRELADAMHAAEAANQAKSAFLATMSHEIRTPMNGVVGILDVLKRSPMSAYQTDLVQTMGESASALLGIIDDILDFSKIEAGRLRSTTSVVNLPGLIESVCWSLKPVARARDVTLRGFIDPRLPDDVLSDSTRLRQVLNNLIGNAIKFSSGTDRPGPGRRARRRPATTGRWCIRVVDNGVGMSRDAQARIFKPFEQAEGAITRRFGGTGLGLSIVSRLCDLLGGTVEVDSEPGAGAVFAVTLPMQSPEDAQAYGIDSRLAGIHCKVVAPEADVRSDWTTYLRASAAEVEPLDGIAALRRSLERHVLLHLRRDHRCPR